MFTTNCDRGTFHSKNDESPSQVCAVCYSIYTRALFERKLQNVKCLTKRNRVAQLLAPLLSNIVEQLLKRFHSSLMAGTGDQVCEKEPDKTHKMRSFVEREGSHYGKELGGSSRDSCLPEIGNH